ncbi:MAG: hypothetical protein E7080_09575 [Bacteroidales bacterium]|nr:hypothetical protein [Bacteroidales bacterium]
MGKISNKIRLTLLAVVLLLSIDVLAFDYYYSYEENGIYYYICDQGEVAVVVGLSPGENVPNRAYSEGDIVIPEFTKLNHRVVAIYEEALRLATSVELPKSIRKIDKNAFAGSKIKSIKIPKYVSDIAETAFSNCVNLENIEVDSENLYYDSRDDCNGLIRKSDNKLMFMGNKSSVIPNSVEIIGDDVFKNRTNITSIDLPNNLKSIGKYAFYGCSELTKLVLPETLREVCGYAFYGCSGLTELILPETLRVVGEYAFYGTTNITKEMVVPKNLKSIGTYAFSRNSGIKELLFTDSLEVLERDAFAECPNLENVVFTTNVDSISYDDCVLKSYKICIYFTSCPKLKYVRLSKVNSFHRCWGFIGCENLEKFEIESGNPVIEYNSDCHVVIRYHVSSFVMDGKLMYDSEPHPIISYGDKRSSIPKDDRIDRIGNHTFWGDLKEITIPENIKYIEEDAFTECNKITDLYMCSVIPPDINVYYESYNISDNPSFKYPKQITVHVPKGSLDNYIYMKKDWTKIFKKVVEWEPSGIDNIEIEECVNDPVVYYNMQGVKVDNPQNGIFIKKQGAKTTKVLM